MKPNELFGVIVRTVGLLCLIYGGWYLLYWVALNPDLFKGQDLDGARLYLTSGVAFVLAGAFLMRGAHWFVNFSYPPSSRHADDESINRPEQ
jgi:hypothetical protein